MAPIAENVSSTSVSLFGDVNYNRSRKCLEVLAARNPAIQNGDLLNNIKPDDFGKVLEDGEPKDNITVEEPLPVVLV